MQPLRYPDLRRPGAGLSQGRGDIGNPIAIRRAIRPAVEGSDRSKLIKLASGARAFGCFRHANVTRSRPPPRQVRIGRWFGFPARGQVPIPPSLPPQLLTPGPRVRCPVTREPDQSGSERSRRNRLQSGHSGPPVAARASPDTRWLAAPGGTRCQQRRIALIPPNREQPRAPGSGAAAAPAGACRRDITEASPRPQREPGGVPPGFGADRIIWGSSPARCAYNPPRRPGSGRA
jgi:hypothetical protein